MPDSIKLRDHGKRRLAPFLARMSLKIIGWKVEYQLPQSKKYILIAAPHTSNWDLVIMLLVAIVCGIRLNWVAKDTLFKGLFGSYLRWLGGIPVNRRSQSNFTQQVIDVFNASDERIIVIAPEATRGKAEKWKSGFYYIAKGANIPVAMGFLDYEKKIGGIGPSFRPTENIERDIALIREFYKNISGRIKSNQSPIRF